METPQSFDTTTGLTTEKNEKENTPKPKKKLIIFVVLVSLLLVGILVAVWVLLGSFRANRKVASAFKNTIEEFTDKNHLATDLDFSQICESGNYTVDVDLDTEIDYIGDISFAFKTGVCPDSVRINGNMTLSYIPPVEYDVLIDKDKVVGSTPFLPDYSFVYKYNEKNKGYLSDYFNTSYINATIGTVFGSMTNIKSSEDISKELRELLAEDVSKIRFVKSPRKEFCFENKISWAPGYVAEISGETITDIYDKLERYAYDNGMEYLIDVFDKARPSHENTNVYVYVGNDRLLEIMLVQNEDTILDVNFTGQDYRAQSIIVEAKNAKVFELKGQFSDGIEEMTVFTGQDESIGYRYDTYEGKFTLEIVNEGNSSSYYADIRRTDEEIRIDIDYFDLGNTYFGGRVSVYPGNESENAPEITGKTFDVGNASEEDYEVLKDYVYELIMSLMGW